MALMACALFPALAIADPVDESEVTTFQPGQPACAEEVNQTIQALVAAINDNAARLAALEGLVPDTPQTLAEKLGGSTFKMASILVGTGTTVDGDNSGRMGHRVSGSFDTFSLNDNGSLSYTIAERLRETKLDVSVNPPDGGPIRTSHVLIPGDLNSPDNDSGAGTWGVSGSTLTLTIDGESDEYLITPDGNMLISGGVPEDDPAGDGTALTFTEVDLVVAIRVPGPPDIQVFYLDEGGPQELDDNHVSSTDPFQQNEIRAFQVVNVGDSTLQNLSIDFLPGDQYLEVADPLGTTGLNPGQSTTFAIKRTALTSASPISPSARIISNDPDESPFRARFLIDD